MEVIHHGNNGISSTTVGGGNNSTSTGGGGPAPFLVKTYEMVDDSSTDEIVSWSSNKNSFIVWDPPEFSRRLLPTYFKHNNFSSFIRQLNTYGFRKIDPERWEFANEEFIKDQKHLLKNIHRRKPIHSHTNPPGSDDPERAALEEEIEKLSREKNAVQTNLKRIIQQKDMTRNQLDELERKVEDMEQRQRNMMTYLEIATKNPTFVEHLVRMGSESMSFSAINKKRRQDAPAISYGDDHGSNSFSSHGFQQDFSKLRLELSPTVSDTTFLSPTEQSSNEDGMSQQTRTSNDDLNVANMRTEALMLAHETLELTDTCASLCPRQATEIDCNSTEDADCLLLCQLSLTLASSSQQPDDNQYSAKLPQSNIDNINNNGDVMSGVASKEANHRDIRSNGNAIDDPCDAVTSNQGQTSAQGPNDVFWERFLTERPVDTEETSSSFRGNQYEDQEDRKPEQENSWRSRNDNEKLSL